VGRACLTWDDNARTDSSLLPNIREWRRLASDRDIWRRTIEEARTVAPLKKKKEEEKEKEKEETNNK